MSHQTDQCAVGPDGQLLDASQIQFFNDGDDDTPLPSSRLTVSSASDASTVLPRGPRTRIPAAKITDVNNIAVPTTTGQRKAKLQALVDAKRKAGEDIVTPVATPQPPTSGVEPLVLDDSDDEMASTGNKGPYAKTFFS
jgi:hypothetical protein